MGEPLSQLEEALNNRTPGIIIAITFCVEREADLAGVGAGGGFIPVAGQAGSGQRGESPAQPRPPCSALSREPAPGQTFARPSNLNSMLTT